MKTNAITRIIIWSLVIVILIGMLFVGLYRPGRQLSSERPAATEPALILNEAPAMPVEDYPITCDETAVITSNALNVRQDPSTISPIVGMVEKGTVVSINRGVRNGDQFWLGIYAPVPGWINGEYVDSYENVVFYSSEELPSGTDIPSGRTAIASNTLPVYSAPNTDSTTLQALDKGTAVTFSRQETINDMKWTYITSPTTGWVPTDLLEEQAAAAPADSVSDLTFDPKQIREIEIEWVAGTITIEPAAVDTIQVSESEPSKPKYAMVWKQTNDKLVIRFCEDAKLDFNFGITINDVISKDLTILVPMGWECDSLEVDAASASLEVYNLTVKEVDFDGASGICSFANCVIDELDVDTASGDIAFFGSLDVLDCDAASASVNAVFENVPRRIDMDSMSGDLDITLPSNAGFEVSLSALSSDFHSELDYFQKNGNHYRGDGYCKINMDAMSGDLYIRELKTAYAVPEVPAATEAHHHTDACTTDPDSCPDNSTHHTEHHSE